MRLPVRPALAVFSASVPRLQEPLDPATQVGERPFFLDVVGDREHDVSLVQAGRHERRHHHHSGRAREVRPIVRRQVGVYDDDGVSLLDSRQRRCAPLESEQLGATAVRRAIGAERQVLDAGQRRFRTLLHAERARPA